MLYENILETIGNTPMVKINNINPNKDVSIYAKLEGFNPTGSIKDRIVKYMIEKAEASGELTKDKILLEATSGNTGISIGMFARIKGYKVVAVMPDNVSIERREMLRAFGAEIILSDGKKGTNGAIEVAQKMAKADNSYYMLDQYSNLNNPLAHYETTGMEILRDIPEKIDVFISGLGTGGTLMGAGKRLKEDNPETKIVAVQPYPRGGLQGLRNLLDGYIPPLFDMRRIDSSEIIKDEDAFITVRELTDKEGIFAGISSAAVICQAIKMAGKMTGGSIVTVLPDGGWKYLSERLWTEEVDKISRSYQGPLW
ncbi:MAG: PLP-dependent cysteine synthase family protein [Nitrospirota bacterium]